MATLTREAMVAARVPEDIIRDVFAVNQDAASSLFCATCKSHISKKKTRPKLCLANGLRLPNVPDSLSQLTRLEERLVAPRHVFQTIWLVMGIHGQY
ncbi:hypothetical protein BDB00DRAFT_601547 [Zychaea mexicana]|uniref:uncharacterized protein n=1 Tax=Zychaea mexicana TaxID=64656 RepID=UPI0022FDD02B|nr:uncharacterized protein BDB00DRAFT_601547 [Zychaea mexicana]KAI9489724.1 hypothetical protein BDB00DRAFT_601547 [Zychaea mexicana]